MFKTIPETFEGREFVRRLSDGACIPFDPANTDYAEYLKWVSEGNQPLPPNQEP